jgi:hypothetical protein
VLSAKTDAAFVSTAGAPTRDSNANGFEANRGQVDVGGVSCDVGGLGGKEIKHPPYRFAAGLTLRVSHAPRATLPREARREA